MGAGAILARVPIWAWITVTFIGLALIGAGALFFGFVGFGAISLDWGTTDTGCKLRWSYIEISKTGKRSLGCGHYMTAECAMLFGGGGGECQDRLMEMISNAATDTERE